MVATGVHAIAGEPTIVAHDKSEAISITTASSKGSAKIHASLAKTDRCDQEFAPFPSLAFCLVLSRV
jgi:hypothetical protein